jgi:hypothetical protein
VAERCDWCGVTVDAGDGYRIYEPAGSRRAVFCRLEHVVPWALRGAMWECAWCAAALGDAHVLVVRARGEHRIHDGLCSVEHLLEWAKAGGRYR